MATKSSRIGMDVGEYLKITRTFNINVLTILFTNLTIYIPQPTEKRTCIFLQLAAFASFEVVSFLVHVIIISIFVSDYQTWNQIVPSLLDEFNKEIAELHRYKQKQKRALKVFSNWQVTVRSNSRHLLDSIVDIYYDV